MTRTTFGRYTLLPQLGQGGMGAVYLALDTVLGRKVALKFLSAPDADPTLRERFLLEARAAASIDHPYICKIYEAGELDGEAFIAMEFLDGQTLGDRLRSGPLEWSEAAGIAIEMSEGLMKAHDRGIVHRDLKPSNIMLIADGHVKVLDFGLAKRFRYNEEQTLTDLTGAGIIVGTPGYMSPEQLSGRVLDHRSDIFSLGVILFEMVTAVHPFRRGTSIETMGAILHEKPLPLSRYAPAVPPFLDAAVHRMLEKEVHARHASMREVWQDLKQAPSSVSLRVARPVAPAKRSIAVLPFVNMSPDPEQEYFSDGITEDIINRLSRIPAFKILARTSVRRFKNSDKSVAEIGRELGVQHILEGSVRSAGNRIRITTGLVDVSTEAQTWGKIYDRDLTDIFAIQSDVSQNIAEALQSSLSAIGTPAAERPRNVEAYSLYLRGRFFSQKLTPDDINKGIRFFEQALVLDPLDARSHAGLAEAYVNQAHFSYAPASIAFPKGKAAALRALELDSSLSEPHTSLALAKLFYDWDWEGATINIRRAIELGPNNVDAAVYHSWTLCTLGRQSESLAEARRAFELDPLSSMVSSNLAWALANNGLFDEALQQLHRTLEFEPESMSALSVMFYPYLGKKMYDEALQYLEKWKWRKTQLSAVLALAGRREQALAVLDEVLRESAPPCWSEVASTYLFLGDREKLAESLDKAFEAREYMIALMADWSPEIHDPLVINHLRRMGLER